VLGRVEFVFRFFVFLAARASATNGSYILGRLRLRTVYPALQPHLNLSPPSQDDKEC